jgi:hypothetical protein
LPFLLPIPLILKTTFGGQNLRDRLEFFLAVAEMLLAAGRLCYSARRTYSLIGGTLADKTLAPQTSGSN